MPIISAIGRKAPRVRLLVLCMYLVLSLGSITMVYPFMIMVAGSTKSGVDLRDFLPFPQFLYNDLALYRKHVEGLFNESLDAVNMLLSTDVSSFEYVVPPAQVRDAFVDAWCEFVKSTELPDYACALGYMSTPVSRTIPAEMRGFKEELTRVCGNDIRAVNKAYGTEFVTWNSVYRATDDFLPRRNQPQTDRFSDAFRKFKATRPLAERYYFSVDGFYRRLYLKPQYTKEIDEYNRTHGTAYRSYDDIRLPRHYPAQGTAKEREDWEGFVRNTLNLLWVRVDREALPAYRAFLRARYGRLDACNRSYGTAYRSFDEVPLVEEPPAGGLLLSDWELFITGWKDPETQVVHMAPVAMLRIHSVDFMFRDLLEARYGTVERGNAALGTSFASFQEILPPQEEYHYREFLKQRGPLKWEFVSRNYKVVLQYMFFHGRGILNTVIYCALAISCALIFNPLAAYAMSRYQMPTTYKILLFLLMTMAFPPMVTQIPVFLMLRNLGLLNTFAALILPGLANGYSIFLLKGFFDSLPRELYESAAIDGAGEWVMFWHITMTLSKPILAVIALGAFTHAYSNFMFALLICQNQKMWTLMVWLYQLQWSSGQGVLYASLIIAAIPTLLVFIFCQNIIMRGIVVPVEK